MSEVNFEKLVEESFNESDWSEFYHIDANEVVDKAFKAGYMKALDVPSAIKVVAGALKNDPDYRVTWKANIAMTFLDHFQNKYESTLNMWQKNQLHEDFNEASDKFLNLLIGNE